MIIDGVRTSVSLIGDGAVTVVLSNQSDEDMCTWMPFTTTLVNQGYRVALWNYGGDDPRTELFAVTTALAVYPHRGLGAIVLMGASKGAEDVVADGPDPASGAPHRDRVAVGRGDPRP